MGNQHFIRSQVLYPALAKGAHERKANLPKGVSGVNSLSEDPFFIPKRAVVCTRFAVRSFSLKGGHLSF